MPEDKLTHDERVRLEALSQAHQTYMGRGSAEEIIDAATLYEKFIVSGS